MKLLASFRKKRRDNSSGGAVGNDSIDEYPIVKTPLCTGAQNNQVLTMPPSTASGTSFFSRLSHGGNKTYKCTVQLLDDADTLTIEFKKHDLGQLILDKVCEYCQIGEKDYFGLRYMDINKHRFWIDPLKPVMKQVHGMSPIVLCLRVKYYPAQPETLADELTRYQLFLQLRRDMLHGRLYCPHQDAAYLGACVLQSELGDYNKADHEDAYVSEYKLFLKQTPKLEDHVAELHKTELRGKNPAEAELAFLQRASTLDTYGFDPYTVREHKSNNSMYLGCTASGILVYHLNRKMHHIPWLEVEKIDYVGKELRIYPSTLYLQQALVNGSQQTPDAPPDQSYIAYVSGLLFGARGQLDTCAAPDERAIDVDDDVQESSVEPDDDDEKESKGKKEPLRFQCPSATFAKHLWKYALAQKTFFTNDTSSNVKPVVSSSRVPFLRGATFRYSGRVLHEIQEEEKPAIGRSKTFVRYHVERQPGRSERTYNWMVGKAATLPRPATKDLTNHIEEVQTVLRNTEAGAALPEASNSDGDIAASANDLIRQRALQEQLDQSPTIDLSPSVSQQVFDERPASSASGKTKTTITIKGKQTHQNGSIPPSPTDEHPPSPSEIMQVQKKGRGAFASVLRILLFTLLFTAILAILVVLLEEAPCPSVQNALSRIPRHDDFRRQYYDPYRMETLARYNRLRADYYENKSTWF